MDEIVKLPIVYHMVKGNCTAESFIELPVSKAVYNAILKDGQHRISLDTDSKPQQLVRTAMRAVCKLQGYTLTAIIPDIKTEG